MKNTRLAFAFILIHLCIMTFAQSSKKITGRVVDEKGELLVGVNIMDTERYIDWNRRNLLINCKE